MDANGGPSPVPTASPLELINDARLTAMGLMVETSSGIISGFVEELESLGVSGSAFEVMIRLARSPGHRLRMSDLAAQSTLTNSGLTRLVDRLEVTGEVTREPCATDRRGWFACLTPHGLEIVLSVLPQHLATVDEVFTGVLEPDELIAFLATLRKLRTVVRPGSDPATGPHN